MRINFHVEYRTVWGEKVAVILGEDESHPLELFTTDGYHWSGCYKWQFSENDFPSYRYAILRDGVLVRRELGRTPHRLQRVSATWDDYQVYDYWRDVPQHACYYTSAFSGSFTEAPEPRRQDAADRICLFRILSPSLSYRGLRLALAGSCDLLGEWNPGRALGFTEVAPNCWQLALDWNRMPDYFEYKLVAVDVRTGEIVHWAEGENRLFEKPVLSRGQVICLPEEEYYFHALPLLKIAGSAIPVFSLRSKGSCGIGDFGDLLEYLRWAEHTRQRIVQILPINDTTTTGCWQDSYPYNAISIYALHPLYIDLRRLPAVREWHYVKHFEDERVRLNSLAQVDYEAVFRLKMDYLRASFLQDGERELASTGFADYYQANAEWLLPYAAFSHLTRLHGTNDFSRWGEYAVYSLEKVQRLWEEEESRESLRFYFYVQYQLHVQLSEVSAYARSHHILLKGDIPIGINRHSVEAWTEPRYFHLDGQAGAPPDAFSRTGQNWGFPTYNWEVMATDGYRWWKRRFAKMATYFTAYRIDHILGFFRIWEIPAHAVHGLLGQFSPSLPMTADEIRSFGLHFDEDRMTRPLITVELLNRLFGRKASAVRKKYMEECSDGTCRLLPAYDTERKIEAAFASSLSSEQEEIRDKLYQLVSNVLFLRDRKDPSRFHPRIAVQDAPVFASLDEYEQQVFNRLYNHYYYERHNEYWYHTSMEKLPSLIDCTPMLVCGEDLGMVPDCVPWVMNQLQILSLEIQRMPKLYGEAFGHVMSYPYTSVCTIGTHDMSTLRGWWKEDAVLTERYYHGPLQGKGEVPSEATGAIAEQMIADHLASPSMLCILTWQDWMAMDETLRNPDIDGERINIPANPRHYWRWRMHLTLEDLSKQTKLNAHIAEMIQQSGRG